ncbi:uncharacterized protein CANTADRAFT_25224 [Suhomyces tanzawaensis NRRL Y-17324]|uniref:L domain-like protein n=1 Tax=Suhomyces tanzawaensis NRRL Y-17324 TaxID=984487 RepID=A0A1E4SN89_9ASCO|nr:uncharacterized protein CANTADRAFT_25224 [Suhomyces tanzawaensis NRRL Y-17324]ODV80852.1 hypothetical protein CANTADRAFT_25224 [Suhomyces tanzawaensis NRRL Y-17324]
MTQSHLALQSQVILLLQEQVEQIKLKRTLKLNRINHNEKLAISEVIECIHEFINSFQPPLKLERLSLQSNQIQELPANLSIIAGNIRYLDLHNNDLTNLSDIIKEFTSLEILDLSSNRLWNLPSISILGNLRNLRVISLKENKFKYLPPVLGELSSLNLIEVAGNPLILPSLDVIKLYQHQRPDLDWVSELKNYMLTNKSLLEFKLQEQHESKIKMNQNLPQPAANHPALVARSKSISETKSKASKAARRMGLIIKKPDGAVEAGSNSHSSSNPTSANTTIDDSTTNSSYDIINPSSDYSLTLNLPHSASATETSFNVGTPPLVNPTSTATTVPSTQTNSPSLSTTTLKTTVPSIVTTNSNNPPNASNPSSVSSSNMSTLSRPTSRNRSRSNTLKEIDKILEKNDIVDTEHKSGAYFRRLSTLQENPNDETLSLNQQYNISKMINNSSTHNPQTTTSSHSQTVLNQHIHQTQGQENLQRQHLLLVLHVKDDLTTPIKSPASVLGGARSNSLPSNEVSPARIANSVKKYNSTTIVKVSRKILFSFSELHSSVRRFTGFCVDKKITMKMVSFLYTTKSNIDGLVENLELMEENGNNLDQIISSLHTCIGSFRSIMNLLNENLSAFVAKIDVCFIRMLYLTLYGSFNEFLNAYRILVPNSKPPTFNAPTASEPKQKLSVNTNVFYENDDMDEKLYRSIEIATSNAQVVFGELTRAIGKSAIASTTSASNPGISHSVATKVKELTNVCMNSMDITKRLKTKLITIRNNASQTTKRLFWDDINLFLKAIIQTFSSVKGIMKDLPILNEVRGSMANLTKTTKDVTLLLEVSSYKFMPSDNSSQGHSSNNPPLLASIPSVSNLFTPSTAHPLSQNSLSLANLSQLNTSGGTRTPFVGQQANQSIAVPTNLDSIATPNLSPGILVGNGPHAAPVTAPAQSTGQYFAKNGMNPFDGLIIANRDKTKEDSDRGNTSFNL